VPGRSDVTGKPTGWKRGKGSATFRVPNLRNLVNFDINNSISVTELRGLSGSSISSKRGQDKKASRSLEEEKLRPENGVIGYPQLLCHASPYHA